MYIVVLDMKVNFQMYIVILEGCFFSFVSHLCSTLNFSVFLDLFPLSSDATLCQPLSCLCMLNIYVHLFGGIPVDLQFCLSVVLHACYTFCVFITLMTSSAGELTRFYSCILQWFITYGLELYFIIHTDTSLK